MHQQDSCPASIPQTKCRPQSGHAVVDTPSPPSTTFPMLYLRKPPICLFIYPAAE